MKLKIPNVYCGADARIGGLADECRLKRWQTTIPSGVPELTIR